MDKFFLVTGILIMVLSGGCSLWAIGMLNQMGGKNDWGIVLVFGGIPFVIGLIIVLLANRSKHKWPD